MHLSVLPACMCVHHMCFWCLEKPEEGIGCLELVKRAVRLPAGAGTHPHPGPLQKQPVLLISERFICLQYGLILAEIIIVTRKSMFNTMFFLELDVR